jgi:hypothetical protein
VSFTPRPFYPAGKNPWYPLDRRLDGPQSWSGRGGEEKILKPCCEWNPGCPNRSLVAISTEPSCWVNKVIEANTNFTGCEMVIT